MAHPNEEMLRTAYGCFARGDLEGYLAHCTPDITFHVPGRSQVAGTYKRSEFISPFISRVIELTDGTFRETVVDVLANGRHGAVLLYHEFHRFGHLITYKTVHVYDILDGKLATFSEYPADLYEFDEAWK